MNMQAVEALKERLAFDEWKDSNTLAESLFIWQFFLTGDEFPGWSAHRIRQEEPTQWPRTIQSVWRPADEGKEGLLSVDIYECASRADAHELVLQLLAEFQSIDVTRQEQGIAGDVAFAPPGNATLLFARGNLLTLMRNASRPLVAIPEIAGRFDDFLVGRPELEGAQVVPAIRRFQSAAKELEVGINAPLEAEAIDPLERPVWYKFFADRGEILLEDGNLRYRPAVAGPQTLTMFAINANRGAASQELRLDAS
ncbi:MAG: hypothetical protein R3300_13115 [Candidatus Promineifilaceae bacterium]|nr:hypothetical protein [Candidatus Promineifilaceae bacterium]